MRTDELTRMLARQAGTELQVRPVRAWAPALGVGLSVSAATMVAWLGVLPDLLAYFASPGWLAKAGFAAAVAVLGLAAAVEFARPDGGRRLVWAGVAVPFALIWAAAAVQLAVSPLQSWPTLVFGSTWSECPMRVAALSLPIFVAALFVMRGMAPTRLRLAGAAAGLFAGGAGATIYALHCAEVAPAFVAVWYVLGMLIPTAVGVLIGPRALRW